VNKILAKVTTMCHEIISKTVSEGDQAIDATVGKGQDTLFLANLVGNNGHVYGFDIQKEAIEITQIQLAENSLSSRVSLFNTGHENLDEYIINPVKAIMFNLGYLPGGDHKVITSTETTIVALKKSVSLLALYGILSVIIYPGHPGGDIEKEAVESFFKVLPKNEFDVIKVTLFNKIDSSPYIIIAQRIH